MRRSLPLLLSACAARWRVALLVCVTTLLFLAHDGLWTRAAWNVPSNYGGDALEILTRIEASAEGDTVPLHAQIIQRLGAPFGADWNAYPSSDLFLLWGLGRVARWIGVFPTANLAVLLATVTAALAFYGCARWLRARWEWSFVGALLFAFTYQTFHRGLPHLFIIYSWTVPPALVTCGIVAASRRVRPRNGAGLFCLLTAVAIGISNPYNLFLYCQLLGWAVIAQWLGPRRRENLLTGVAALGIAVAGFFISESHLWFFAGDAGAGSPIVRNYFGTEYYSLKPLELLIPPANHRWPALAFFGRQYLRWSGWRTGEPFAPYLGLAGIAALTWLLTVAVIALLRRRRLPGAALPVAWVFAFASFGGVLNLVAFLTGLDIIRATNRYSIFIVASVLLFAATRLSRRLARWPAWVSVAAAVLTGAFGVTEQLPKPPLAATRARLAAEIRHDRRFGAALERAVPPGGMVFELPVLGFPEAVAPWHLRDYEPFRPYLATRTLRFTYGPLKGGSRGQWQRDVAALPVPRMVHALERAGFAAVYIDRRGFRDHGRSLLERLGGLGYDHRIENASGNQVAVLLHPAAVPRPPTARTLTFGNGWYERRFHGLRWAYGPATFSYFNPSRGALPCRIVISLRAVDLRHVRVAVNGRTQFIVTLDQVVRDVPVSVSLRPGFNRIDLEPVEPPVRHPGHFPLRTFAVEETRVTPVPAKLTFRGRVEAAPAHAGRIGPGRRE